jgi:hypothetical protein
VYRAAISDNFCDRNLAVGKQSREELEIKGEPITSISLDFLPQLLRADRFGEVIAISRKRGLQKI